MLSFGSINVFASGEETWYKGSQTFPTFILNPYNLTPVKTMGDSGQLTITARFYIDDKTAYTNPVDCKLQIRSTDGTVLASKSYSTWGYVALTCEANVYKGQKVQIYMSVYDSITGETRYAKLSYTYMLR